MNRRFALAVATVALLAVSAGCLGYATGGGEVTNETLDAEPPHAYDFDTDRDAAFNLTTDATYTVVYAVGDREEIRVGGEADDLPRRLIVENAGEFAGPRAGVEDPLSVRKRKRVECLSGLLPHPCPRPTQILR